MSHRDANVFVAAPEAPRACEFCHQVRECRPYGGQGRQICAPCGKLPENILTVHDEMAKAMGGASMVVVAVDSGGRVVRQSPEQPIADKVAYVLTQRQTRKHHCHWPGCSVQVPPAKWGCLMHWRQLPKVLRDKIWAAYAPGQEVDLSPSDEYLEVAEEVQRWIREHGGPRR